MLDATLVLSFCCVGLYWICQRTLDAGTVATGGRSATVSDGLMAISAWGQQQASRVMPARMGPASGIGRQSRSSRSTAQHSTRPGFSRTSVSARWSRTFARVDRGLRPVRLQVARRLRPVGSLRLRLLLPRLSYAAAAAAQLLGCLQQWPTRRRASTAFLPAHCLRRVCM